MRVWSTRKATTLVCLWPLKPLFKCRYHILHCLTRVRSQHVTSNIIQEHEF